MKIKIELIYSPAAGDHCLAINDIRVAGGKPMCGGTVIRSWKISMEALNRALKVNRVEAIYLGEERDR